MANSDFSKAVKEWVAEEFEDEAKYQSNMALLRALALFGGAVFIMRNFGEFLAI